MIGTHKGHDIATFDVYGAYLHAEIPKDKRILMNIIEGFFNIMCQVNTEYKQHVRYKNGKRCYTYYLSGLFMRALNIIFRGTTCSKTHLKG